MNQSGSGKRHEDSLKQEALEWYRDGYRQEEIEHLLSRTVPSSTLSRWIKQEIDRDPDLRVYHDMEAAKREVGVPRAVFEEMGTAMTLLRKDAVTGEVMHHPAVLTDLKDFGEREEEYRKSLEPGAYSI